MLYKCKKYILNTLLKKKIIFLYYCSIYCWNNVSYLLIKMCMLLATTFWNVCETSKARLKKYFFANVNTDKVNFFAKTAKSRHTTMWNIFVLELFHNITPWNEKTLNHIFCIIIAQFFACFFFVSIHTSRKHASFLTIYSFLFIIQKPLVSIDPKPMNTSIFVIFTIHWNF